ncbi:amidase family protein [Chelativorans sp. YIM 93263]|uniref:amidase family protein n=1 Tax=Chelativorans sp. YIM 93263 TaxID=2906648 RepID=UPI002379480C|nr:amidase family protein [Chelativorans sp. YIM 93263]
MRFSPLHSSSGRISFRAADRARTAIARALEIDAATLETIFTQFDAGRIAANAAALDKFKDQGPLAGLLVSIKDLFDEAGIVTTAGSKVLAESPAAEADAEPVSRLKHAGAIACGRTTMSEFAYSGVGLNPHFGNPGNSRDGKRITGGSTSGGALTVALGIADVALGSDTGGSVRIPAALNGLAGFKPTQSAVPLDGAFPLSGTYDSIGPLAHSIEACAAVHSILSGSEPQVAQRKTLRIGVMRGPLLEGLDEQVSRDFERALSQLGDGDFEIAEVDFSGLDGFAEVNRIIVACDAHRIHENHLDKLETLGDPRVLKRIRAAQTFTAGDEKKARAKRARAVLEFAEQAKNFDVFAVPTLPVVAPLTADVEADFDRLNGLMLRNPSAINFLDGCAATIPMQGDETLATGLMLFADAGRDWQVLDAARRAERILRS